MYPSCAISKKHLHCSPTECPGLIFHLPLYQTLAEFICQKNFRYFQIHLNFKLKASSAWSGILMLVMSDVTLTSAKHCHRPMPMLTWGVNPVLLVRTMNIPELHDLSSFNGCVTWAFWAVLEADVGWWPKKVSYNVCRTYTACRVRVHGDSIHKFPQTHQIALISLSTW